MRLCSDVHPSIYSKMSNMKDDRTLIGFKKIQRDNELSVILESIA